MAKCTDFPNSPDKIGSTPIHLAAASEVAKAFLSSADTSNPPDDFGRTPFQLVFSNGHNEIVKMFLNYTNNQDYPCLNYYLLDEENKPHDAMIGICLHYRYKFR